uniref:Uncharacterized protein n=1 Tax=Enterococcus faecium TaxID=1352 RepID=A0A0D5MC23_ENTFC|nr:hypothetical protein pEfm12493_008 [Enterococcus faecium]
MIHQKPLAGGLVVFFYVLFRLTGRLTVFFGNNFTIKPFTDVMRGYFCYDCKKHIEKVIHNTTSSPCQNRPG